MDRLTPVQITAIQKYRKNENICVKGVQRKCQQSCFAELNVREQCKNKQTNKQTKEEREEQQEELPT